MSASTSVTTAFRGTTREKDEVLAAAVGRLSGPPPDGSVVMLDLDGGRVALAVGPSADDRAAAGGEWDLAALRFGDVGDQSWQRVVDVVRRLPYTGTELAAIAGDMPITRMMPALRPRRPLEGLAAICTIHHQSDFVFMMKMACELGLEPADVTVVDKLYRYADTHRVDATLEQAGFTLERYDDLEGAVRRHLDRAAVRRRRTILVDDGGYLLPVVHVRMRDRLQEIIGLVEQTTSGIWKLPPYSEIGTPIFSVAESRLKGTIESYGVADAAFRSLCHLLPNEMWEGRPVAVLGHGRLGAELAQLLRDRHARVIVHDADAAELARARHRGFATCADTVELLATYKPVAVFGASGARDRPSLSAADYAAIERDTYLVSVTSRDREFDVAALAAAAVERFSRGRVGTTYRLANGAVVTLVADGFPVNFHYAESMPNRYSDLVLAAMLFGACVLADPACTFQPGHNVEASDAELEGSDLLRLFHELYL